MDPYPHKIVLQDPERQISPIEEDTSIVLLRPEATHPFSELSQGVRIGNPCSAKLRKTLELKNPKLFEAVRFMGVVNPENPGVLTLEADVMVLSSKDPTVSNWWRIVELGVCFDDIDSAANRLIEELSLRIFEGQE